MGTTRMSDTASMGVTDGNAKVHNVRNFVCRWEFAVPDLRLRESNLDDRRYVVTIGGSFEI